MNGFLRISTVSLILPCLCFFCHVCLSCLPAILLFTFCLTINTPCLLLLCFYHSNSTLSLFLRPLSIFTTGCSLLYLHLLPHALVLTSLFYLSFNLLSLSAPLKHPPLQHLHPISSLSLSLTLSLSHSGMLWHLDYRSLLPPSLKGKYQWRVHTKMDNGKQQKGFSSLNCNLLDTKSLRKGNWNKIKRTTHDQISLQTGEDQEAGNSSLSLCDFEIPFREKKQRWRDSQRDGQWLKCSTWGAGAELEKGCTS